MNRFESLEKLKFVKGTKWQSIIIKQFNLNNKENLKSNKLGSAHKVRTQQYQRSRIFNHIDNWILSYARAVYLNELESIC